MFRDRLINEEDENWFDNVISKTLSTRFERTLDQVQSADTPLLFGDFAPGQEGEAERAAPSYRG